MFWFGETSGIRYNITKEAGTDKIYMRVALISSHSLLNPGGVKRHVFGLHKEFQKRGIYSKIIAPRRSGSENYGKEVILLGTSFPFSFSGGVSDFTVAFNPLSIEEVLRRERFDILHFHNFLFPSCWQVLKAAKPLSPLKILTLHANVFGSEFLMNFPFLLYLWRRKIKKEMDGLIGVASLNLRGFEDFRGPKKIIPNGVDIEEFRPKPEDKGGDGGMVNLLFVGRLEKRKGLIYLLRAYKILEKKFNNIRLIIVGKGPLERSCRMFVQANRLKRVYFEGQKTDQELVSYYNWADIFVSPAIFGESFGIVLLEAMACGKPVVAFDNIGYREFLKDKKGAVLAKNRDENALAKSLAELIKNKKRREEMGRLALEEARAYSWSKIAEEVLNFYKLCQQAKTF